jgi:hypothetical protein
MKAAEKDKLATSAIISVLLFSVFAIMIYMVVSGFQTLNPAPTQMFAIRFGQILGALGMILGIFCFVKKKFNFLEYAITAVFFGLTLLGLEYFYFEAYGGYGKYYYAGLIGLIGLYVLVRIGYTVYRVVRG